MRADNAAIKELRRRLEERDGMLRMEEPQRVCHGSSPPAADGATNDADAAPIL